MPSSSRASRSLPVFHVLAEGAWLAVLYAALQAATGQAPRVGPLELAILAGAGMGLGRRRGASGAGVEAFGLPLLALLGGAVTWVLDPAVRAALIDGLPLTALGLHLPGWIGVLAVWRGHAHRVRDDDERLADERLRWAVPGLAVPWLLGYAVSEGSVEAAFTAAAFAGTLLFVGSAFAAIGVARLEAMRAATGADWRSNRSWLALVVGTALAMTAIGIPAALLLGVPASVVLTVLIGPLRAILLVLVVLSLPLIAGIAAVTEFIGPLLPREITLPTIDFSGFAVEPSEVVSDWPVIIFYAVVALLLVGELAFLAFVLWMRWQARREIAEADEEAFEERAIVVPPPAPPRPRGPAAVRRRARHDADDPVGAYLAALDALERDGRWPRQLDETPAAHAARVRRDLPGAALGRLAAAYQLVRYAERGIGPGESRRAKLRLSDVRRALRT